MEIEKAEKMMDRKREQTRERVVANIHDRKGRNDREEWREGTTKREKGEGGSRLETIPKIVQSLRTALEADGE